MPFDFSDIPELRLSRGNHASPNDGLCFMELAAYFAGEAHSDKPDCACPVLGAYGIRINDAMPADLRDALLKPLVPLIVGTRDRASEQKRAEFLVMWAVNKVLPVALHARGFADHAKACERARTLGEAKDAADAYVAAYAAYAAYVAANAAAYADAAYAAYAAYVAANAAAANADAEIWPIAVEGLKQAILIGKHEGFADPEPVIVERRERLRELVVPHFTGRDTR